MKKIFLGIAIVLAGATYVFAADENVVKSYATTGILEISGNVGFSGARVSSSNEFIDDYGIINFSIKPQVDYFFFNGFHVGMAPNFGITSNIFDNGSVTGITIGPVVSPGYCFKLTDMFYLDLAPAFGYLYLTYIDSGDRNSGNEDEMYLTFEMFTTLKIAVGNAIVNVGIFQSFGYNTWYNTDGLDIFYMGLTVGFSVYF
ncbi:MAG TPA: hypothetical protein P5295_15310 [Spirochaetota bacterium]|nr:hypothetical protein [Spirochaetota bacterium]